MNFSKEIPDWFDCLLYATFVANEGRRFWTIPRGDEGCANDSVPLADFEFDISDFFFIKIGVFEFDLERGEALAPRSKLFISNWKWKDGWKTLNHQKSEWKR